MRRDVFGNPGFFGDLMNRQANIAGCHFCPHLLGDKEIGGADLGPRILQVFLKNRRQFRMQRNDPVFVSLSVPYGNRRFLKIDILNLEVGQFGNAQAGISESLDDGVDSLPFVFVLINDGQKPLDFFFGQVFGNALRLLGGLEAVARVFLNVLLPFEEPEEGAKRRDHPNDAVGLVVFLLG